MILLRRGLWPAGLIMVLGGGQHRVAGMHHMQRRDDSSIATPTSAPTTASQVTAAHNGNSATMAPVYFPSTWAFVTPNMELGTPFIVNYALPVGLGGGTTQGDLTLALLWTDAQNGVLDATNTYELMTVSYDCLSKTGGSAATGWCQYPNGANGTAKLNVNIDSSVSTPKASDTINNFFFCFATGVDPNQAGLACESYSQFFSIKIPVGGMKLRPRGSVVEQEEVPLVLGRQVSLVVPTNILSVTQTTGFLTFVAASGISSPSATASQTISSTPASTSASGLSDTVIESTSYVTQSGPRTYVATTTTTSGAPTATGAAATSGGTASSAKSTSGLGTGPIIGIAVAGGAAVIVIMLLAFFCARRRKRTRQQRPEQVLLTHGMHNLSRDLVTEKGSGSPGGDSTGPMLASILETRPSTGQYDHLDASAPYSGLAGNVSGPRRNTLQQERNLGSAMGTQIAHTELSRGLSDASLGGPISPRSTNTRAMYDDETSNYGDEPYHDLPIYGETRHVPQVYVGSLQAPFLSEPGMTDEELSRLEEEERRIDAAIAEAERRR